MKSRSELEAEIRELTNSLSGDAAAFVNLHKQLDRIGAELAEAKAEIERWRCTAADLAKEIAELKAELKRSEV